MKIHIERLVRTWGEGLSRVLFLEILQKRLPTLGFGGEPKIDYDGGSVRWYRDVGDIELVVSLSPWHNSEGDVEFTVQIGLNSKVIKHIFDTIKPWECNTALVNIKVDRSLPTERVANLNFSLMVNFFSHLKCASTFLFTPVNYHEETDSFLELLSFTLDNIVIELSDTKKLSNELVNLSRTGRDTSDYGLSSSDAMVYAAFLNYVDGNRELAVELLGEGRDLELESNKRIWNFDKNELEVSNRQTQCQFDKYIRYVKS